MDVSATIDYQVFLDNRTVAASVHEVFFKKKTMLGKIWHVFNIIN